MLPQDHLTAAQIKTQKAQELSVKVAADMITLLKRSGYTVKKGGAGWTSHLVKCAYPLGAGLLTENGAWQICERDYTYRIRQRKLAADPSVIIPLDRI